MEFVLGYLFGSGANWQTIVVVLVICGIIALLWKWFFGFFGD